MATDVGTPLGVEAARRKAADYADLVRLPNLFTAPPDVLAGVALAVAVGATASVPAVLGLCVASALVYAAGATLNDVADAAEDRRERPDRPIPSGRVGRTEALSLGVSALVAGVVVAAVAAGPTPGVTAAALAGVVVLYDGLVEGGPAGFLAMGAARALNVGLGLSVAGSAALDPVILLFPAGVFVYTAAVTRMAAADTGGGDAPAVALVGGAATLAAMVVAVVATLRGTVTSGLLATLVAACFLAWDWRSLGPAMADPIPERVGRAARTCVFGVVLLDAAVAVVAGWEFALLAGAFVLPATTLARQFEWT